ncbi:MAG: MFS transporter [Chloroflexota bacterium]
MLTRNFKIRYGIGDLSLSMPQAIIAFYQLFFLVDIAGLSPDRAGLAVIIGRLWDSVNDPLFGLLSDRIRSRFGRRRVLLLFGAIPMGLAFCLQFIVPPLGEWNNVIYYAAAIIFFDTIYTAVHVSYNALTPAITSDYDEQSSLNGFRMSFSIVGSLLAVIAATVLGFYIENQRILFMTLGIGLGVAATLPILSAYSVSGPYDETGSDEEPMPAMEAIRATLSNRPFWMVMGLYLFSWTTASLLSSVLIFFANYYLNIPDQANYLILVAQVSAIAFIPFWVWMAQRFDKRRAFIWGCISWIVVLAALASIGRDQVVLAYILAALSGAGIATAFFLPWAMIPDVIELDELKTGRRREGSFYAFAAFFQKLGTGLVIWLFGMALASRGYITPVDGQPLPVQPPEAIQAIRWSAGLVPAILLVAAIIFAWYYPITREYHEEIRSQGDEG